MDVEKWAPWPLDSLAHSNLCNIAAIQQWRALGPGRRLEDEAAANTCLQFALSSQAVTSLPWLRPHKHMLTIQQRKDMSFIKLQFNISQRSSQLLQCMTPVRSHGRPAPEPRCAMSSVRRLRLPHRAARAQSAPTKRLSTGLSDSAKMMSSSGTWHEGEGGAAAVGESWAAKSGVPVGWALARREGGQRAGQGAAKGCCCSATAATLPPQRHAAPAASRGGPAGLAPAPGPQGPGPGGVGGEVSDGMSRAHGDTGMQQAVGGPASAGCKQARSAR